MATALDEPPSNAFEQSEELFEQLRPIFADRHPFVQGAAMSQLLALYLAGHLAVGNDKATARLRRDALKLCIDAAWSLTPIMYQQYVKPKIDGGEESG